MKWKRSEFREARAAYWRKNACSWSGDRADADVQAAEAAGVVWDHEEPLPERLAFTWTPGAAWVREVYPDPQDEALNDGQRVFLLAPSPGDCDHLPLAREVMEEAVRRWNAWKEIRRLVECAAWPPSTIKSAVLAILDGKEGE